MGRAPPVSGLKPCAWLSIAETFAPLASIAPAADIPKKARLETVGIVYSYRSFP
jgi:hypothetical protein